MAQPVAVTYTVASGPINAGRFAGGAFAGAVALGDAAPGGGWAVQQSSFAGAVGLDEAVPGGTLAGYNPPAWMAGAAVHQVVEIAGTAGAGGAPVDPWSTFPLIAGTATLVSAANGGHQDSGDNRVTSIDLLANSPAWQVRIAATSPIPALTPLGSDYYPDGKPTSRHGYHHAHYIAQRGRLMLFGQRGRYAENADGYAVDGHSVTGTWAWDAAGTYPSLASGRGYGVAHDPTTGNVWCNATGWRWNQATNNWTQPLPAGFEKSWRWPVAFDAPRSRFFTLQFGNGEGAELDRAVVATVFDKDTGDQTTITFNASPALSQFIADAPEYAGMDYDADNDRFLFYDGRGARVGRIYVITPNAGTTWDMSLLTLTGASIPATVSAGINGRFRYVPPLKGFVLAPSGAANLYFFRVA